MIFMSLAREPRLAAGFEKILYIPLDILIKIYNNYTVTASPKRIALSVLSAGV
jgi:hypothetical protein